MLYLLGDTAALLNVTTKIAKTCFLKGYSHFWGFDASPFSKFDFPAKGLYTFAKVQKDTSDCCGDLEIEGFMCDILKNNTPVRAHSPCVTQAL